MEADNHLCYAKLIDKGQTCRPAAHESFLILSPPAFVGTVSLSKTCLLCPTTLENFSAVL